MNIFKTIWNALFLDDEPDSSSPYHTNHDFLVWCFGEGYRCQSSYGKMMAWNEKHSDLFEFKLSDELYQKDKEMYQHYLNYKSTPKDVTNDKPKS